MKTFLVKWPGSEEVVPEFQLADVCGRLTSSGLSHEVCDIKTCVTDRAEVQVVQKPKPKTK